MKNTGKTRLEAFREAQKTGQIAISETTAGLFVSLLTIEENVDNISDLLGSDYDDSYKDEISDRVHGYYEPMFASLMNEIASHIKDVSLSSIEFQGL